jgi:[acyl-carrier-protein] S-malonyltransferase
MRIGVVFPGQGSQVVGMGVQVAEKFPAARECYRIAKHVVGYDLFEICANGPETTLRETRYAQPAIFVTNMALAAAVGEVLEPVVSAGHSFGEYCSLQLGGALSFEAALALVNERALAMHHAAGESAGGMSAVLGLEPDTLRRVVAETADAGAGRVALANFNAPGQIVISGDLAAVRAAGEAALAAGAKRIVPLNVAGAWHSSLMAPAQSAFERFVRDAAIVMPRFTVISNVDAKPYTDVMMIRDHLERSVTHEVRWHETALAMIDIGLDLIVEFGASPVIAPLMKRVAGAPSAVTVKDVAGVEKLRSMLVPARA